MANLNMKIQITSRKLITPSSPTPSHLQNLKISSFDQHGQHHYAYIYFFYEDNGEECGVANNGEKSLKLQNSLSEILTLYYPFAGRYSRDDPVIKCNDMGAEYLEAQVNVRLSQILSDGEFETKLQNHFAPQYFDPNNSPPLAFQFSKFECGGVGIGVSLTHKIADAFSIFRFMNAWATACRIGINKVNAPSFELGSFFPPRNAVRIKNWELTASTTTKIVTKRFVFDDVAISNLKAVVSNSELPRHQITRVKVVIALIWRSLIRVSQARHGRIRPSLLKVPINLRGKTNLKVPENSCGNFISWASHYFTPNDMGEVQLHDLVSRIHDGIESTVSNYGKALSGDDLFFMVMNNFRKITEAFKETEVDVRMFSCWCHFPMYDVDFGWGKPTLVSRGVKDHREVIMLVDTKDGKGIEAWVSLEEKSMFHFQQDPDILALTCDHRASLQDTAQIVRPFMRVAKL